MDDGTIEIQPVPVARSEIKADVTNTPDPDACEPWSDKSDLLLRNMIKEAETAIARHQAAVYYYRQLDYRWRVPGVLVPALGGPVVLMLEASENGECNGVMSISNYISGILLVLTSLFSIVSEVYGFNERHASHERFIYEYTVLITDIEGELVKHRSYRNNVEVVLNSAKLKWTNIALREPTIPMHIYNTVF